MTQTKKWNRIIVLALVTLAVVVVHLTIRNDYHFNEKRESETKEITMRDSLAFKQMDSLSSMLTETIVQLDSIFNIQKKNSKMEIQNHECIKNSLDKIRIIEQQILNSMK